MRKTEFYEIAVKSGFYGLDKSGLTGKKDNVRKYWEDISIKVAIQPIIKELLETRDMLRIVDLGSGSGEGYELLTHIPHIKTSKSEEPFILGKNQIQRYDGIDISPAMVAKGKENYKDKNHIRFYQGDLAKGFPLSQEPSYDIYFSSYCSLSHLTSLELELLSSEVFTHADKGSFIVYDLHGRLSPEWPIYWDKTSEQQYPYNMAYLLPLEKQDPKKVDWFNVTYWSSEELTRSILNASVKAGKKVSMVFLKDRSILIGRHMDTKLFKAERFRARKEVNHLFDRDYRGKVPKLRLNLDYLNEYQSINKTAFERINYYYSQWSAIIEILDALIKRDDLRVKQLIESSPEELSAEMKMLAWLYRNADRFPVVDFWASVMGPQAACVLRNLELGLPDGLGCGHSILCIVRVDE